MKEDTPPTVLFCVLNWGLGHATRSIPIIRELVEKQCRVTIASDGMPAEFLRREFPNLRHESLPAYGVRYPTKSMAWNVLLASPGIFNAIRRERRVIRKFMDQEHYDAIISDNRYGCWDSRVPSVLITHQLQLPVRGWLLSKVAKGIISLWFKNFNAIWVPDFEESHRALAGNMSQSGGDDRVRYLGILSTMKPLNAPIRYQLLAVLSGPEPQRSHFESAIREQLDRVKGEVMIVRGVSGNQERRSISQNAVEVDFLNRDQLGLAIAASEVILCRSGYSSLMDIIQLGKRAILVPTPGQPEQEILAESAPALGGFVSQSQSALNLPEALIAIHRAKPRPPFQGVAQYETVVSEFLLTLEKEKYETGKSSG